MFWCITCNLHIASFTKACSAYQNIWCSACLPISLVIQANRKASLLNDKKTSLLSLIFNISFPSKDVPLVDYPNLQAQRCTWWCCKDLPISSLQWRSISSFFSFKYLSWNPSWGFADLLFCFFPCRESGTSEGVCVELRGTSIWWLWVDGCYEKPKFPAISSSKENCYPDSSRPFKVGDGDWYVSAAGGACFAGMDAFFVLLA
jgi:hypothetical protein